MNEKLYTIGIDYGSDSARAVLTNALTGDVVASSSMNYPRWMKGLYCDAAAQQHRQHPLDYIECLEAILSEIVSKCDDRGAIKAIAVDTTGSTPCFTDAQGMPLSLREEFKDDPDAMFILWKDHTGAVEAEEITAACAQHDPNYACQSGNHYSSECTWAKVLHTVRKSAAVRDAARGIIEEADFITNLLTGCRDFAEMKIGHCLPSVKQLWKKDWGGFPPEEFFAGIDPMLPKFRAMTPNVNYGCHVAAGTLCPEWAEKLGLSTSVVIGVGNCDAYSGAIGAGIEVGKAVLNLGTSACYMAIAPLEETAGKIIDGIFGQADDSVIEGYCGYESGLSAFGDIFAWFRKLLDWPAKAFGLEDVEGKIIPALTRAAAALPLRDDDPIATDHFNGRRCPEPNNFLTAGIAGLHITTSAPEIFKALVEAAAFASKAAIDIYIDNGVRIDSMVAIGGIAQKSPYVMQVLADVVGRPIEVSDCKDSCALGAAIYAAVAAGLYDNVFSAEKAMCPGICATYTPDPAKHDFYMRRYEKYKAFSKFNESLI